MNRNSLVRLKSVSRARSIRATSVINFDGYGTDGFNTNRALLGSLAAIVASFSVLSGKERRKVAAKEAIEEAKEPPKKEAPKKFKQKRMQEYENKIRMHSQPDKVFRYFATVAAYYEGGGNNDIYMTPDDFIRSLTPGGELQPDNLLLDQYRKIKTNQNMDRALRMNKKELSKLEDTFRAFGGYINYEDYMFLLMLLTTPRRNFEIAFRMFDLDGNGVVDAQEFDKVSETIMRGTSMGKRHAKKKLSNISTYFFGEDRTKTLTSEEFVSFQADLQRDILKMEFSLLHPDSEGIIKEKDFANMLLIHARFDHDKTRKIRKRINRLYKKQKIKEVNEETGEEETIIIEPVDNGVSFDQIENFFNFIKNIHDVEIAFTFFAMSGKEIDEPTLIEVARTVCGVELNDRIVKIIYTIFDEDGNGTLSHKEFIDVMKKRLIRGLDSKRELGFVNKFTALTTCTYEAYTPEQIKVFFETIGDAATRNQNREDFEGQFK